MRVLLRCPGVSASSGSLTLTSTPTNGNIIVLAVGANTGKTVSTVSESGVTWARQARSTTNGDADVWVGSIGSSASKTITLTMNSSSTVSLVAAEYSGVTATLDGTTATGSGSSTTPASPSLTPTVTDLALSAAAWQSGAAISASPTNGYALASTKANGTTDSVALSWTVAGGGAIDGGWHQIDATFASNSLKLYIDSTLTNTATASFTTTATNTSTLDIGRNLRIDGLRGMGRVLLTPFPDAKPDTVP